MIKEITKTVIYAKRNLGIKNTRNGMGLKINSIQGNTQQDSTTGKNLLYSIGLTEQTINGVTFTPVYENGMLQYIKANGTCTDATALYTIISQNTSGFDRNTLLNKSLIISGKSSNNSGSYISFYNASGNSEFNVSNVTTKESTFTFTNADAAFNVVLAVSPGITVTDEKFYPMLRLSSVTDGTYEPFTNGASPNPLYPQSVNSAVVSEVKVHGKNFLENREIYNPITIAGITFTKNEDGSITFDGVQNNHSYYDFGYSVGNSLIDVLDLNEKYILSGNTTQNSNEWGYCLFLRIKTEGGSKYVFNNTPNEVEFDLSTYENITDILPYIRVGKDAGKNPSNITFYPMIRKADISEATYEPYQENTITISEPIELNGIGSVQDEVAEGKLTQRVIARKLNSLTFTYDSAYQAFDCVITDYLLQSGITCMSNRYSAIANVNGIADMANKANYSICFRGAYANRMYIKDTDYTDGTALKNSFTEDDVVYYLISEPVVTDLPTADQIALNSLETYDGVSYVSVDSEVQPLAYMEYSIMEYKKWQAGDYFNAEDYNRIIENISYLKDYLDRLFYNDLNVNLGATKDYLSLIYAREINAIENVLESINIVSYGLDIGQKQTFRNNGKTPLYSEFDRIESSLARLCEQMVVHEESLPRLSFRLGSQKGLKV